MAANFNRWMFKLFGYVALLMGCVAVLSALKAAGQGHFNANLWSPLLASVVCLAFFFISRDAFQNRFRERCRRWKEQASENLRLCLWIYALTFCLLLCGFATAFTLTMGRDISRLHALSARGVTATGRIEGFSGRDNDRQIIYRFSAAGRNIVSSDQESQIFTPDSGQPQPKVGDRIRIVYDRADPSHSTLGHSGDEEKKLNVIVRIMPFVISIATFAQMFFNGTLPRYRHRRKERTGSQI